MSTPAVPSRTSAGGPPPSLASRPFPRRVRRLLEGVLEYASDQLDRDLDATLNDLEQQLFKFAEQARSNDVQQTCFAALRNVKRGCSDLVPRFMIGLEAALARLRDPESELRPPALGAAPRGRELALVGDSEIDEHTVLIEIASRAEARNSLPLWLLGQRFGVLAAKPAFEPDRLPVGPQELCRILAEASRCIDLNAQNRILLFRSFERTVLPGYGHFIEAINAFLIKEGVLPRLTYVPVRVKPVAERAPAVDVPHRRRDDPRAAPRPRDDSETEPRRSGPDRRALHPRTQWPGEAVSAPAAGEAGPDEMFGILRELLASRRQLLAKLGQTEEAAPAGTARVASGEDVRSVLSVLQQRPVMPPDDGSGPAPARSIRHIKQDLLMQLRQLSPDGQAARLPEAESDAIDLVGMLFEHIMKNVRPHSPAAMLLNKLQVPLLRVAMDDLGFFTRNQHPARQMLNTIAETGAQWLGEEESDRVLVEKMQLLVDRAVNEFDGDPTVFEALQMDLNQHMQAAVHRAEAAERRHVEAARGKERLALAQKRASELVAEKLGQSKVPRFVRTLLTQAWADVLALTLLRQGEDSESFAQQLALAERLVKSSTAKPDSHEALSADEARTMETEIEQALGQVGYHPEDAQAIARRLVSREEEAGPDDAASRTELALRLKARARLGRDVTGPDEGAKKLPPLAGWELQALEQIKQLPFGTWFEFTLEPEGERVRRRMSWYSTVTGHALFVNHRGQRVGEHTLDWLARAIAAGKVEIVQVEKGTLIDRAWSAILGTLRSFAGRPADESGAGS